MDYQPNRPEWKPSYLIPFTQGRKDYKTDRLRYDKWYSLNIETKQEKLRTLQTKSVNWLSIGLITLITTLWTVLPPMIELPWWLNWTHMGMSDFGWENNWGNQLMLTLVPTTGGTVIQNIPKIIPNRKLRFGINLIIKIIPVLILCLLYIFIKWEKEIHRLNKEQKELNNAKTLANVVGSDI